MTSLHNRPDPDKHSKPPNDKSPTATTGATLIDSALNLAYHGWLVIPLHDVASGKCSCGNQKCDPRSAGKHPRTKNGLKDGTTDAATIRRWWKQWPSANIGICTGADSGIWMLGPDGPKGIEALAQLEQEHSPLPATPKSCSGSGGQHRLFRWPADGKIKNRKNHLGLPIDVRGDGGYFVAPPSTNANGPYLWEMGPDQVDIAEAPQWLIDWCRREKEARTPARQSHRTTNRNQDREHVIKRALAYLSKMEPAISGQKGHDRCLEAARVVVYGFDLGPELGYELLASHYNPLCQPPWSERELRHKCGEADTVPFDKARGWLLNDPPSNGWHSAGRGKKQAAPPSQPEGEEKSEAEPPPEAHLTDQGNAQRIVARHGQDLRYCHAWKQFFCWDGRRWAEDDTGEAMRRVKDTQRALYRWASERLNGLEDDGKQAAQLTRVLQHALKWEDARRLSHSLELVRSEPGIPIRPADLDRSPWLLNAANGTINLKTGELLPHDRLDLITKIAPVAFDAEASCPLWERCLNQWMDGNPDLVDYLRRVVGYALTADVSEQVLFFLHGAGSNGKSTFLGTIREALGDYACQAVSELLLAKNTEAHPTERADLFGRRFVATIEADEGKRMAEALMKQLTGGDNLKARKMRQDFFEMTPTWKIFLAANHKPVIRGTDFAVWRRIRLIPFTVTIQDRDKDKDLAQKLRAELPGILAWAVRGCLEWQRQGLADPEEVRQATAEYQREQDALANFFADCCTVADFAKVKSSLLLNVYKEWSGDKTITPQGFRQRMNDKGFHSKEGTGGSYFYHGIGLTAKEDEGEWR